MFTGNGPGYDRHLEAKVYLTKMSIIEHFLKAGSDVVVDDTNLESSHIINLQKLVSTLNSSYESDSYPYSFMLVDHFLEVSLEDLLIRREDSHKSEKISESKLKQLYNTHATFKPVTEEDRSVETFSRIETEPPKSGLDPAVVVEVQDVLYKHVEGVNLYNHRLVVQLQGFCTTNKATLVLLLDSDKDVEKTKKVLGSKFKDVKLDLLQIDINNPKEVKAYLTEYLPAFYEVISLYAANKDLTKLALDSGIQTYSLSK